ANRPGGIPTPRPARPRGTCPVGRSPLTSRTRWRPKVGALDERAARGRERSGVKRAVIPGGTLTEVEVGPGGKHILVDDPDGNPIELHEAPRKVDAEYL